MKSVFQALLYFAVVDRQAALRGGNRRVSGLSRAILLLSAVIACFAGGAQAAPILNSNEGHINFYKHTGSPDDLYTANPSPADMQFMDRHWPRLLSYSGYWDDKLSWFPDAWMYVDSYAVYSDPNNAFFAQLIQSHPDWILRDAQGNPLYINWGCGGGTCPQYAANLSNPNGFRAWWIQQVGQALSHNPPYKGLFIDDVNLDLSRISDGSGNLVTPIDPATGQPMTNAAWRKYFADFMVQVRRAFPAAEIVHNTLWFLDWSDPNIQREIQAADWVNLERGVNDPGITGGDGYWSLYRLMWFIYNVHQNGKGVILDGEGPPSDSDAAREYSAAFYLLVSTGADLIGDTSQSPANWWRGFDTDLGKAANRPYVWQGLWRRDFAGGMALVNPPGSDPVVVTLPAVFTRVDGSVVNTIRLGPAEGAILNSGGSGLSALDCGPVALPAGAAPTCTVTLAGAAPPSGAAITLSSSSDSLVVPASVFVPAGASSATFNTWAGAAPGRTVMLKAHFESASVSVTLQLGTSAGSALHPPGFAP